MLNTTEPRVLNSVDYMSFMKTNTDTFLSIQKDIDCNELSTAFLPSGGNR